MLFWLDQICWLLNYCFLYFAHYFALLMYFLTSHVHNSVSCEISMARMEANFPLDKVQNQSFSRFYFYFIFLVVQDLLGFRFFVFRFWETQIICQNTRVRCPAKLLPVFAVDKPKVVPICISNFLAPATCPTFRL